VEEQISQLNKVLQDELRPEQTPENTNESQRTWPRFKKRAGLSSPAGTKSIGSQASLFCSLVLHCWPLLNSVVLHGTSILP